MYGIRKQCSGSNLSVPFTKLIEWLFRTIDVTLGLLIILKVIFYYLYLQQVVLHLICKYCYHKVQISASVLYKFCEETLLEVKTIGFPFLPITLQYLILQYHNGLTVIICGRILPWIHFTNLTSEASQGTGKYYQRDFAVALTIL